MLQQTLSSQSSAHADVAAPPSSSQQLPHFRDVTSPNPEKFSGKEDADDVCVQEALAEEVMKIYLLQNQFGPCFCCSQLRSGRASTDVDRLSLQPRGAVTEEMRLRISAQI
ncbi:hypothetical protein ATANTOWER_006631 [Ataeniobius toweri]|uniref:Uncharacterized protein n=1 Tax=Ataeniobius toweri TaxID=208326 RepID=A0ABU7ANK3_9TELE|nr:hypothetical protein [Ataeniobius toweri]